MSMWGAMYQNFLRDLSFVFGRRRPMLVVESKQGLKKYDAFVKSTIPSAYKPSLTYAEELILEPEVAAARIAEQAAREAEAAEMEARTAAARKLKIENEIKARQLKEQAELEVKLAREKKADEYRRLAGTRIDEDLHAQAKAQHSRMLAGINEGSVNFTTAQYAIDSINPKYLFERRMMSKGETRLEALLSFYHLGNCPQCGEPMGIGDHRQHCMICHIDVIASRESKTEPFTLNIKPSGKAVKKNEVKRALKKQDRLADKISKFQRACCSECGGYMAVQSIDGGTRKKCQTCSFEARTIVDFHQRIIDLDVLHKGTIPTPLTSGDMNEMAEDELDEWQRKMDEMEEDGIDEWESDMDEYFSI
jgi:hypothetical protein